MSKYLQILGRKPAKYSVGEAIGTAMAGAGGYFGEVATEQKKAAAREAARVAKVEDDIAAEERAIENAKELHTFKQESAAEKTETMKVTIKGVQYLIDKKTGETIKELGPEEEASGENSFGDMKESQMNAFNRAEIMTQGLDSMFELLNVQPDANGKISFTSEGQTHVFDSTEAFLKGIADSVVPFDIIERAYKNSDDQTFDAAANSIAEGALRAFTGAAAPEPEKERVMGMLSIRRGMDPEVAARNLQNAILFRDNLMQISGQDGWDEMTEEEKGQMAFDTAKAVTDSREEPSVDRRGRSKGDDRASRLEDIRSRYRRKY